MKLTFTKEVSPTNHSLYTVVSFKRDEIKTVIGCIDKNHKDKYVFFSTLTGSRHLTVGVLQQIINKMKTL